MSLLIAAKLWLEIDTETYAQPCGYLTNGELPKNIPLFSKQAAIRLCQGITDTVGLTEVEVKVIVDCILASPLADGYCEMDRASNELTMLHRAGQAPDVDELGLAEALKRRLANRPKIDMSQDIAVGQVGDGIAANLSEDIKIVIDNGNVLYGALKCGNVMTQPFFSKHCARICLEGMTRQYKIDADDVVRTSAAIEAMDIFPEEAVGYDHATARFLRMCVETRRSKRAIDHIHKLIRLGIFLDLFGDDGDPA